MILIELVTSCNVKLQKEKDRSIKLDPYTTYLTHN